MPPSARIHILIPIPTPPQPQQSTAAAHPVPGPLPSSSSNHQTHRDTSSAALYISINIMFSSPLKRQATSALLLLRRPPSSRLLSTKTASVNHTPSAVTLKNNFRVKLQEEKTKALAGGGEKRVQKQVYTYIYIYERAAPAHMRAVG